MTMTPRNLADRWSEQARRVQFPDAPGWLQQLRSRALTDFTRGGLPHRKVEAWKYTPMRRIEALDPMLPAADTDLRHEGAFPDALLPEKPVLTMLDGEPAGALPALPDGVTLLDFNAALERFESRLRGLAEEVNTAGPAQAFAALNTAYIHRGLVLHVAAGVDAGDLLVQWAFSGHAEARLDFARLFVLMEAGSELNLVEHFESSAAASGALSVILQTELGAGARLCHVRVQRENDESVLLTSTTARQAAGSHFAYRGFDLGGGLVRHELTAVLAGEEAHCDLAGACVLDGSRHGDTRVCVDHVAPGCSSEQFFRGVLGGKSRGVFNGRAMIAEGADGSSVQQSNANLLLSRLAEMDTKPELEIYADEVEASHGATVGQLDETAVFYLRTRGLSEAEARRLLTAAFCHTVTSKLDDQGLAESVGAMVDAAMPESEQ
jgi:Fe-S cluster assembly protein SufD